MKNFINLIKGLNTTAIIVIVVAIILSGLGIYLKFKNPSIDNEYIIDSIKEASELTTAEIKYTGMSEFKDSGIPILNRTDFIMVYKATARFGIDVKDIEVDVSNLTKTVSIKIPKAEILDVKVDSKNIKYFDEKFSLFNLNSKEDANKAVSLAEEKAMDELKDTGVLEMANKQAEALVKGLIQDLIPDGYNIEVKK